MELYDRRTAPARSDTWFVYGLVDSRQVSSIRYVGITNNPRTRLSHHCSASSGTTTHKSRWVLKVIRDGGDILIAILHNGLSQQDAKTLEIAEIAARSGSGLTNLTNGGDGASGWVPSDETKRKIADANRGRKLSQETRDKISRAGMGRPSPNKGKNLSAEWRLRISNGGKVRMSVQDNRDAISASHVARYQNPAERVKTAKSSHMSGPPLNNKSGYKGVSFQERTQKWVAQIKLGKQTAIGRFTSPEDAARAYDKAAFAAWGSDCYLNFPADMAA